MYDLRISLFNQVFGSSAEEARRILEVSYNRGIVWSHRECSDYPRLWKSLSRSPLLFSYMGRPVWNDRPALAVVGSRTPMRDTLLWMQQEFGAFLRECDVAVISGGARGIDQWAHRLAMDRRRATVCVYPSGLLNPYPPGFEATAERILAEGGALISTFGLEEGMRKDFFHIRNRWIAGLSGATFVAEANRRSGSALSARLAVEEGREVATLPVFPMSAQGLGNLQLLNDGATLIRDAIDLAALVARTCSVPRERPPALGEQLRLL